MMMTVLYLALAAFAAFVALVFWNPEKPAVRREVSARTSGGHSADPPSRGLLSAGDWPLLAVFVVGSVLIVLWR